MDNCISNHRGRDASRKVRRSGDRPARIFDSARVLGLSDAGGLGDWGEGGPYRSEEQCKTLLESLLQPLGWSRAEALASCLINEFGSLPAILAAGPDALKACIPDDHSAVDFLMVVRATMLHSLRIEARRGPVFSTSEALINYLLASMAYASSEHLRVLFLNASNSLLRDEVMGKGSVTQAPIYPREIMKRALELGATALILVHNHPSGDPYPSRGDIEATERIVAAASALEIAIHDHLVIAKSGWTSFRERGLL
jgi:DNA repair protein RadC